MNTKKVKLVLFTIIALFIAGVFIFTQFDTDTPSGMLNNTVPPPTSTSDDTSPTTTPATTSRPTIKNPTINNAARDFSGKNSGEDISFTWERDERVAEYVLLRSDSPDGPFQEVGRMPAGGNFPTNAMDITADAKAQDWCYMLHALDAEGNVIRVYEHICIPKFENEVKNPTISNADNDLVAGNDLESVGMTWDHDERATEYIILRSESSTGPFIKVGHVPAGIDISTNATDITPDARTKTLCYKIEAVDERGRVFRIYEPVCVPSWQE